MSDICIVYPKGKKRALPDGFKVDPRIAKQLGLKDGQEVSRSQVAQIMRMTAEGCADFLAKVDNRRSQTTITPQRAPHFRRGDVQR